MSGILAVPIHGTEDEILELPKDALPEDPNEIMQILANELAPLKLWLELAVSYYQQHRMEQFQTVMETSTGEDGPFYQEYYKGDKEGRIALLNCLAAYNTQVAARSKNKHKKEQHLQMANDHYQNSDKIDSNMPLTWCGKALIHMAKISIPQKGGKNGAREQIGEHLRDAGFMFDQALECDKTFIPALLGKAAVLFNSRKYQKALDCYKQVLMLNPACPPEVRLGIAHCYGAMRLPERAREAFQRVLDLAPDNTEALAGMAVIDMNTTPEAELPKDDQDLLRQTHVASALKLMERAYNSSMDGKNSAVVLNHLANHFIVRGEVDKAYALAYQAFQNTEVKSIRAESCFHIARTHHIKGQMDQAHKYYEYAAHFWPEFMLPQYGLGQTNMHSRKWMEAIACLDKVLKVHPHSYEVRKMLGVVCARSGDTIKSLEHFKKILEREPENNIDEDVWNELATLHEKHNPAKALQYHHKAREALKRRGKKVTPQLLGNIGTLYHKLGNKEQALSFYNKALRGFGLEPPTGDGELVRADGTDLALQSNAVTVLYNLARLHEQANSLAQAHVLYRAILKERPNYLDAFMRLGAISETRGNSKEASGWYVEALTVQPGHADAWTMLSKMHFRTGDFAQSQQKLEKVLSKNPNDAMAHIMLGNIYFVCAKFEPGAADEAKAKNKYTQHLSRALDLYRKVLERENNNVYAANGVATVLAQSGRLAEAKQIFAQLREAAVGQVPDVWVNLAHIHMVQKEFVPAIKLYKTALDRFFGGHDVLLLTCIAKAQLELAMTGGRAGKRPSKDKLVVADRAMAKQCRRTLQKAMHLAPRDRSLQFNLALVIKLSAESIIKGVAEVHKDWLKDEEIMEAPLYVKADMEMVKNDIMVLRRISDLLATITDEREFPKEKKKEAASLSKWGEDASKVLPQYTDAVEEMREMFQKKKDSIRTEEEAKAQKRVDDAQRIVEAEEEAKKALQERARAMENKRRELVGDSGFLKATPKQKRLKDGDFDEFIDDAAARSSHDKKKNMGLGGKTVDEHKAIMRGLAIFLAPSDDEDAGSEADKVEGAADFLADSDEEAAAEKGSEAGGGSDKEDAGEKEGDGDDEEGDEEGGRQLLKRRRVASNDDDDKENDGDGEGEGGGRHAMDEEGGGGAGKEADGDDDADKGDSQPEKAAKKRKVLEDEEDD